MDLPVVQPFWSKKPVAFQVVEAITTEWNSKFVRANGELDWREQGISTRQTKNFVHLQTMKASTLFTAVMPLLVCGFDASAYGQKTIYLTFDMDMNEIMYERTLTSDKKWYDPALFTYLEHNNVAATFFVSGLFALAYPDLIEKFASNPAFSFQNHSYDEASFTPHCYRLHTLTTARQKIDQIERTEEIIKNYTGQRATYFRFPGICRNAQEDALVESLGYTIDDGTVIAGDPFNEHTESIVGAVLAAAKDVATVIMHVGGPKAPKSLAALEQIVPQLRAEGYQFAALDEQNHAENDQSPPEDAMSSGRPQSSAGRQRVAPWSSPWRRPKARQQLAHIRGGLPRRYSINTARGAANSCAEATFVAKSPSQTHRNLRRGDCRRKPTEEASPRCLLSAQRV